MRGDLLTPREREVAQLMARGLTNGQIAEALGISFATAKTHVSDIIGRLGVASREEAVTAWRQEQRLGARLKRTLGAFTGLPIAVKVGTAVAATAIVGGAAFGAWALRADEQAPPSELVVQVRDLPVDTPVRYDVPSLGSTHFGDPIPLWVVRHPDDSVSALIGRDPHSGCVVPWDPNYRVGGITVGPNGPAVEPGTPGAFKALCSGWVFLADGSKSFGASPRGLDGFPVRRRGDEAVVDLTRYELGVCAPGTDTTWPCSRPGAPTVVDALPAPIIYHWGLPDMAPSAATPRTGRP